MSAIEHELLSREQLAEMLSVSPSHISNMQAGGKLLAGIRLGSCKRWRKSEVLEWINAGCPDRKTWNQLQSK